MLKKSLAIMTLMFIIKGEFILCCSMVVPVTNLPGFAFRLVWVTSYMDKLHSVYIICKTGIISPTG